MIEWLQNLINRISEGLVGDNTDRAIMELRSNPDLAVDILPEQEQAAEPLIPFE